MKKNNGKTCFETSTEVPAHARKLFWSSDALALKATLVTSSQYASIRRGMRGAVLNLMLPLRGA